MDVKQTLELPDGSVTFQGTLSQAEVDLVVAAGLNYLLQKGILPIKAMSEPEIINMVGGSEELQ